MPLLPSKFLLKVRSETPFELGDCPIPIFENNKNLKRVDFESVKARYLRFVGLSSQNGADYAAGAEFTILAD